MVPALAANGIAGCVTHFCVQKLLSRKMKDEKQDPKPDGKNGTHLVNVCG